jgi:hypothetical protein
MTAADLKQHAPAEAFAFESTCQFAEPTQRSDKGLRKMKINVLARTGKPVYHWYWGWIVHDMAGMQSKDRIAFDYRHDPDEPIGYADSISATTELNLSGELISRSPEDEAAKIMDLGPAGVPYEASIQFNPMNLILEYLPGGMSTDVNGETIEGPMTIAREWELMRCAICLTGVDSGSQTNFQGSAAAGTQFELNWRNGMTKTPDTKPTDTKEADTGKQSADTGSKETPTNPADQRAQFEQQLKSELSRYVTKFGAEDGTKYFTEGVKWEQALEAHIGKLESTTKSAVAAKEAAEAKLSQLNLGETSPIDTGKPGEKSATSWESQFKQAGATAAAK